MSERKWKFRPSQQVIYKGKLDHLNGRVMVIKFCYWLIAQNKAAYYVHPWNSPNQIDVNEDELEEHSASLLDQLRPLMQQKESISSQIETLMPLVLADMKQRVELATNQKELLALQDEIDEWPMSDQRVSARHLILRRFSKVIFNVSHP